MSFSNNTIQHRIGGITEDLKEQLVTIKSGSRFHALQFGESTDFANLCYILGFVRYECSGTVNDNFLFCRPLHTRELQTPFLQFWMASWWKAALTGRNLSDLALTGQCSGVVPSVKIISTQAKFIQCCIHRKNTNNEENASWTKKDFWDLWKLLILLRLDLYI